MKAFTFDNTGVLVKQITLDQDPLEPGRLLMPPNCTTVPPPPAPAGQAPRWNGKAWDFVSKQAVLKR